MDMKLHVIAHNECVFVHSLNGPKVFSSLPSWPLSDNVVLEYKRNKWFVVDKQSHKGVFHNGKRIKVSTPVALKSGSVLFLGPPDETIMKYECFFVSSSRNYSKTQRNKRQRTKTADVVCSGANCCEKVSGDTTYESSEESQNERVAAPTFYATRSRTAKNSLSKKNEGETTEKVEKAQILSQKQTRKEKQSIQTDEQASKQLVAVEQSRLIALVACEKRCSEFEAKEKQQKVHFTQSLEDVLEKSFTCAICTELYIKAVLLDCSHTFCTDCLHKCKQRSKVCPICRTTIGSEHKAGAIDDFIDAMVDKMDAEYRRRRNEIVMERISRYIEEVGRPSSEQSTSAEHVQSDVRSALMVVHYLSRIGDSDDSD